MKKNQRLKISCYCPCTQERHSDKDLSRLGQALGRVRLNNNKKRKLSIPGREREGTNFSR